MLTLKAGSFTAACRWEGTFPLYYPITSQVPNLRRKCYISTLSYSDLYQQPIILSTFKARPYRGISLGNPVRASAYSRFPRFETWRRLSGSLRNVDQPDPQVMESFDMIAMSLPGHGTQSWCVLSPSAQSSHELQASIQFTYSRALRFTLSLTLSPPPGQVFG